MPATRGTANVLVELEVEVHLVKDLQCHMLLGVDMMTPYAMSLDFDKSTLNWTLDNISTEIRVKAPTTQPQRCKVKIREQVLRRGLDWV
jgi:hypothetical protein